MGAAALKDLAAVQANNTQIIGYLTWYSVTECYIKQQMTTLVEKEFQLGNNYVSVFGAGFCFAEVEEKTRSFF